jgi:homotetrameric cytidine deaminase
MSWKPLLDNAYVPYSKQPETCIVESANGLFYGGVRLENISYPLTIPAVQAAFAICLSEGEKPAKLYVPHSNLDQLHFWSHEFNALIIETDTPPLDELEDLSCKLVSNFDELERLEALLDAAVTPNSDFPVSALLFFEGGYFEGVNIEVSEWSEGICAERVALAKAIAQGIQDFDNLAVHTRKGEVSSPCGACRQVIAELLPYHPIKLHHSDGTLSEHLSIDLLPFSFKSNALKK